MELELPKKSMERKNQPLKMAQRRRGVEIGKKAIGDPRPEMKIVWWNGGGKVIQRLKVNPVLQQFLETKPDIFVYGEALIYKSGNELKLDGYEMIVHKAHNHGVRRGMVVFYRKKYACIITKGRSSKKFDTVWLRMKTKQEERIFGFFYAPGANHEEKCREEFYDELSKGVENYKGKKIYLLGDSNARLGEFSADTDINGNMKSNKNKLIFLSFIRYAELKYLNRIYERGKPTYEIMGKKRSIIDVALTNNIRQVVNFEVIPKMLGVNSQTCHKLIRITIRIEADQRKIEKKPFNKFKHCSEEALMLVKGEVAGELKTLRLIRGEREPKIYTYKVISSIYQNAKAKYIGYRKRERKKEPVTMAVRTMQAKIKQTLAQIDREKKKEEEQSSSTKEIDILIQIYQLLEKELNI